MHSDNSQPARRRTWGWLWLLASAVTFGAAWVFLAMPLQQENAKLQQDLEQARESITYYQQELASANKDVEEIGRKLNETRQANDLWQTLENQGHSISRKSCDRRVAFLEKQLRLAHKQPDSADPGHLQDDLKHQQNELMNLMELAMRVSGAVQKDCDRISACTAKLGQSLGENANRLIKARKIVQSVMRLQQRLLLSEQPGPVATESR